MTAAEVRDRALASVHAYDHALAEVAASSVALADQVRNLDWRARRATRKGRATAAELAEVRLKARAVMGA